MEWLGEDVCVTWLAVGSSRGAIMANADRCLILPLKPQATLPYIQYTSLLMPLKAEEMKTTIHTNPSRPLSP